MKTSADAADSAPDPAVRTEEVHVESIPSKG
jgi:hypothetical protein